MLIVLHKRGKAHIPNGARFGDSEAGKNSRARIFVNYVLSLTRPVDMCNLHDAKRGLCHKVTVRI